MDKKLESIEMENQREKKMETITMKNRTEESMDKELETRVIWKLAKFLGSI